MDVIYNWLLLNIGNEGNDLTILNVQPHKDGEKLMQLDVMARTKNFEVVNLSIKANLFPNEGDQVAESPIENEYSFKNTDQIIAYLSEGQKLDSTIGIDTVFHVSIMKPSDGSDEITFPPQK